MKKFIVVYFILVLLTDYVLASDYKYILHDSCINLLYNPAIIYFDKTDISVARIPQGVILSFELIKPEEEFYCLSKNMIERMNKIEYFLAKIKNPVIIEVHVGNLPEKEGEWLKKWEISTVIANRIETYFVQAGRKTEQNRIYSVGYGEFLPPKNTPYNGGNYLNRVDIIILCKVIGE